MNREQAQNLLDNHENIKAFAAGKVIQFRTSQENWKDTPDPNFIAHSSNFRIKPEPRVFYLNLYGDGSCSCVHRDKAEADVMGRNTRTECVKVVEEL